MTEGNLWVPYPTEAPGETSESLILGVPILIKTHFSLMTCVNMPVAAAWGSGTDSMWTLISHLTHSILNLHHTLLSALATPMAPLLVLFLLLRVPFFHFSFWRGLCQVRLCITCLSEGLLYFSNSGVQVRDPFSDYWMAWKCLWYLPWKIMDHEALNKS